MDEEKPKVEVYCDLWCGHCEGCEVGGHRAGYVKCTGPDWATGRHTIFIDADHPYIKENRVT